MVKLVVCKTGTMTWNDWGLMNAENAAAAGGLPPAHQGVECNISVSKTSIQVSKISTSLLAYPLSFFD